MKTKQATAKLSLKKKTITNLNQKELNGIKGGTSRSVEGCPPCFTYPLQWTQCFNCQD